jgi:diguanylate cyclase (GGDEF)-like protein
MKNVETEISEQQSMQLLKVQKDILECVIIGSEHQQSLDKLCQAAEGIVENAVASVMLLNSHKVLFVRAAPNIIEEAIAQLNGMVPAENNGSCGTAVYSGEPQYVANTSTDRRWQDLSQFAHDFHIQACWSIPIKNAEGSIIGSFALSSFEERAPSAFQKLLLETIGSLASLIIAKEQSDLALINAAHTDYLTRLANRVCFEQRINKEIIKANKKNQKFGIIFFDLNNFKQINDTYGHQTGDEVLCCLAKRMNRRIRTSDLLARFGGDEFVMLIADAKNADAVKHAVNDILETIQQPIILKNIEYRISSSAGISLYPDDGKTLKTLLRKADQAMYIVKNTLKNNNG